MIISCTVAIAIYVAYIYYHGEMNKQNLIKLTAVKWFVLVN